MQEPNAAARSVIMPTMATAAIEILLVEDDKFHQVMARKFLDKGGILYHLHTVADGKEALQFLRRQGPHGSAPRPELILLDLNLPLIDGYQVYAEIKKDPDLEKIPLMVLTGSDMEAAPERVQHIPQQIL